MARGGPLSVGPAIPADAEPRRIGPCGLQNRRDREMCMTESCGPSLADHDWESLDPDKVTGAHIVSTAKRADPAGGEAATHASVPTLRDCCGVAPRVVSASA